VDGGGKNKTATSSAALKVAALFPKPRAADAATALFTRFHGRESRNCAWPKESNLKMKTEKWLWAQRKALDQAESRKTPGKNQWDEWQMAK
jgi:hypothetical protein